MGRGVAKGSRAAVFLAGSADAMLRHFALPIIFLLRSTRIAIFLFFFRGEGNQCPAHVAFTGSA